MKRIIPFKVLFTMLLCAAGLSLFAQDDEKKKDGWDLPNGIRFGYQASSLRQDGNTLGDPYHRGYIGYVRKIGLAKILKLETGLEYMLAGAEISDDTELQLHYAVVPAELVVQLGPFVGEAGVSANFRLAERYKVDGDNVDRGDKSSFFDLAVNAGVGFNILFMTIEARHYWGLLDVEPGWTNDYWQAGLKFNF